MVVEPVFPDQWAMDPGHPSEVTGNGNRWRKFPTSRSLVNNDGTLRNGVGRVVKLEDYERTTRPQLIDTYLRGGYCWVVTGSTQYGRAQVARGEVPNAIRYYDELRKRADVVYRVAPWKEPVRFSFDDSFNYRPLTYERPGPEIVVYRLRDCRRRLRSHAPLLVTAPGRSPGRPAVGGGQRGRVDRARDDVVTTDRAPRAEVAEDLPRVKVLGDAITHASARFLGPVIPISGDGRVSAGQRRGRHRRRRGHRARGGGGARGRGRAARPVRHRPGGRRAVAERTGATFVAADARVEIELEQVFAVAEEPPRRRRPARQQRRRPRAARASPTPRSRAGPACWTSTCARRCSAMHLAIASMRRRGGGAIVNVGSAAGVGLGPHAMPEYAAAKAGLMRLTGALAPLAGEGIRVSCVCPGMVDTPASRRSRERMTRGGARGAADRHRGRRRRAR